MLTIIGSVPTKILDIPASLSDVMNQLKKISISLAGFMATQPIPPSKLVLFSSYESIYNFSRKKKFHIVQWKITVKTSLSFFSYVLIILLITDFHNKNG